MAQNQFTPREQIIEIVNKLFIYTDHRKWQKILDEVFAETVLFDMASMGGEKAKTLPAKAICDMWQTGFEGLDAIHHQAGNYIVTLGEGTADVYAYAIASHFKSAATQGKTREFVGSYQIHLVKGTTGWRISKFKYNLKYSHGNLELS